MADTAIVVATTATAAATDTVAGTPMQDVAMLRRGAVMLAMQVAVMLEAPMQAVAIAAARQ